MNRKKILLLTLLICFNLIAYASDSIRAVQGIADLSSIQFSNQKTFTIIGAWEFWWGTFIEPSAFQNGTAPHPDYYPVMPSYWTDKTHGKQYPAQGSATYRLILILPDSKVYGIYLSQMVSAYDLYINGVKIGSNGRASSTPEQTKGEYKPSAYYFIPENKKAEIILHISNKDYRFGGQWKPITIGYAPAIQNEINRMSMQELFLFGSILIIGLYNIAVFLFRPKNKSPLFFGLFCFFVAIRIITTGTIAVSNIFENFPWELQIKLELSIFYLGSLFFAFFFWSLYPKDVPLIPIIVIISPFFIFTLLALVTPLHFFNKLVTPMEILTLLGLLFVLVCIIIAAIKGRENAWLVLAGFTVFFLTAVNDILFSKNIIHTAYMVPFGLFSFIFVQAVNLAKLFSNSFTQVEKLSEELTTINNSLTRFVPNEFLAFLNKQSITDVNLGDQTLRTITILFADIKSFTTLSETMSPQDNFNFLNSYLSRIGPIIRENCGFIDKYIGDAIMALFAEEFSDTELPELESSTQQTPTRSQTFPCSSAAGHSITAALSMYKKLKDYNDERKLHNLVPIEIGIGIHTGQVMLGIIGEKQRIESTVISDTVNVTSRIERLTRTYLAPIIVSGSVVQSLPIDHPFHIRRLDNVVVKGKSRSFDIYQVLDTFTGEEFEKFMNTKKDFEHAVALYEAHSYIEALNLFKECYYKNQSDKTCLVFIQKIKKALQIESVIKELDVKQ
ncbi:MAG TPA: adenylate/guanylate cyclase domain-containing protein [Spirochaetia bacterium]|nr:adenylate/guanylate cyclase domain-containing protein [Spirochaetia bacterium]